MNRRSPEIEAAQVEAVLELAGLTRKRIAAQLHTDEATLSKIFNGNQLPHPMFWVGVGRLLERSGTEKGDLAA